MKIRERFPVFTPSRPFPFLTLFSSSPSFLLDQRPIIPLLPYVFHQPKNPYLMSLAHIALSSSLKNHKTRNLTPILPFPAKPPLLPLILKSMSTMKKTKKYFNSGLWLDMNTSVRMVSSFYFLKKTGFCEWKNKKKRGGGVFLGKRVERIELGCAESWHGVLVFPTSRRGRWMWKVCEKALYKV